MSRSDSIALAVSLGVHALLLLVTFTVIGATPDITRPPEQMLVEVELLPADARPMVIGPPEAARQGAPSEASEQLEAERPTPPAATPVRVPERRQTQTDNERIARPRTSSESEAQRPSPPSSQQEPESDPTPPQSDNPSNQGGNAQGESARAGTETGENEGSGGEADVEVGFDFGNRNWTCPTPPSTGLAGRVTYRITFAPNGRYVLARPVRRNSTLENSVESVLPSCRAAALPPQADQVNQSTTVTFNFTVDHVRVN